MAEVEIGIGKSGRQAYGFDDIAIVPSRRTRDPEDVDISWEIDAYKFDLPRMGAALDGVTSPATAVLARERVGGSFSAVIDSVLANVLSGAAKVMAFTSDTASPNSTAASS